MVFSIHEASRMSLFDLFNGIREEWELKNPGHGFMTGKPLVTAPIRQDVFSERSWRSMLFLDSARNGSHRS